MSSGTGWRCGPRVSPRTADGVRSPGDRNAAGRQFLAGRADAGPNRPAQPSWPVADGPGITEVCGEFDSWTGTCTVTVPARAKVKVSGIDMPECRADLMPNSNSTRLGGAPAAFSLPNCTRDCAVTATERCGCGPAGVDELLEALGVPLGEGEAPADDWPPAAAWAAAYSEASAALAKAPQLLME